MIGSTVLLHLIVLPEPHCTATQIFRTLELVKKIEMFAENLPKIVNRKIPSANVSASSEINRILKSVFPKACYTHIEFSVFKVSKIKTYITVRKSRS